jgi:hypothetical protein
MKEVDDAFISKGFWNKQKQLQIIMFLFFDYVSQDAPNGIEP